jgi:hypothetical protein
MLHYDLLNYGTDIFRKLMISALMSISFIFINSFTKIIFNKKWLILETDSAASNGGQGELHISYTSLGLRL